MGAPLALGVVSGDATPSSSEFLENHHLRGQGGGGRKRRREKGRRRETKTMRDRAQEETRMGQYRTAQKSQDININDNDNKITSIRTARFKGA